ncbi:heterokaryon incompatibility protein-domain-containing protein [Xylaria bambusicola]|uniref:heterokaryon incompatibility protein-domain-containing protein n=1 Tax=Xylaria bambusicola TaxID=326684 RepID=UPI00200768B0|nr:heterokaryon incompatibility protein-domain-containing protein [Xylaria bambusicola]KAI0517217.1 heterokaryon incompatibility protein-domain-containing protein [Xylaria bambusicola]
MRLINVHTLELEEFWGREPPAYAILSHTWGSKEVSFQEWKDRASISHKAGYRKIRDVAQLTESFDIDYCWVDTNCIDKSSSAELSEAINCMFAWYSKALCCFVHLDDVASVDERNSKRLKRRSGGYAFEALQDSRWFTRGWTLQELTAPAEPQNGKNRLLTQHPRTVPRSPQTVSCQVRTLLRAASCPHALCLGLLPAPRWSPGTGRGFGPRDGRAI